MNISIQIDENDRRRIRSAFELLGRDTEKGLAAAINATAKEARTLIARQVNTDYATTNLGMQGLKVAMRIRKAAGTNPVAEIISKDGSRELYKFKVSPKTAAKGNGKKPKFFKAKVLKSSAFKKMVSGDIKAFVTSFSSGHTTLAERNPGKRMRNRRPGKKSYITKHNMALKALYSVPVPMMLGGVHGYLKVTDKIDNALRKNIDLQIEKILGARQ